MQIDPLEVATVLAASVVLTLLFDLPMQEVKSVIMESTDALTLEASSDEKKTSASEDKDIAESAKAKASGQTNVFEDDEVASTGWDWQKDITHGATGHETEEKVIDVLKKANGRRMSFIETHNSEEVPSRGPVRNPYVVDDSEEEIIEYLRSQRAHELVASRNRRSLSRTKDGKRLSSRESESEEDQQQRRRESDDDARQFRRSESRGRAKDADDRSWEFVGKEASFVREQHEPKPFLARSANVVRRTFSSESEEDSSVRGRSKPPERVPSSDARTSDEEDWERELKVRRKQFVEKLTASQQSESLTEEKSEVGDEETLKRRSSAEGRIAMLKDDLSGEDSMDSWTVSVGPRITLLGSSQEPSEPEEDVIYMRRREYREQGPPSREESQSEEESSQETSRRPSYTSTSQKTSMEEEEEDVNSYNFVLTKDSKRESLQDLSKLSQEELVNAGWNVVKKEGDLLVKPTSTGLFKRESIIKSQASEEDPEYLLPERPKLVQQEREHPFKKAWQVQKSRSEEEGSAAYVIREPKDSKEQQSETKPKEEQSTIKREHSGEQSSEDVESLADDEASTATPKDVSTDTEDNRTGSKSGTTDETDSISTEYSRTTQEENHRQSSRSETDEDSGRFNWLGEDENGREFRGIGRRGRSEEADWEWEQEET